MAPSRNDLIDSAVSEFLKLQESGDDVSVASFVARPHYADLAPELEDAIVGAWAAQEPKISGFEIFYELGGGKFGTVWLARENSSGQLKALKVVRLIGCAEIDINGVRQAMACLRDSTVADLYVLPDSDPEYADDRAGRFVYYSMRCADGVDGPLVPEGNQNRPVTLELHICNGQQYSAHDILLLAERLCRGISFLHDKGRRHYDIKPSNILLVGGQWKIADVGLVDSFDRVQERRYTAGYRFPDQLEPLDSRRHDIYAIGTTLFQLLEHAKCPEDQTKWNQYLSQGRDAIGGRLDKALRKILLSARAGDFKSASCMLKEIHETLEFRPPDGPSDAPPHSGFSRRLLVTTGLGAVFLGPALFLLYGRTPAPKVAHDPDVPVQIPTKPNPHKKLVKFAIVLNGIAPYTGSVSTSFQQTITELLRDTEYHPHFETTNGRPEKSEAKENQKVFDELMSRCEYNYVVTIGTNVSEFAHRYLQRRPDNLAHVFIAVTDPVASGLVKHLGSDSSRGNIAGVTYGPSPTKHCELLKRYFPNRRLAFVYNPDIPQDAYIAANLRKCGPSSALNLNFIETKEFGLTPEQESSAEIFFGRYQLCSHLPEFVRKSPRTPFVGVSRTGTARGAFASIGHEDNTLGVLAAREIVKLNLLRPRIPLAEIKILDPPVEVFVNEEKALSLGINLEPFEGGKDNGVTIVK